MGLITACISAASIYLDRENLNPLAGFTEGPGLTTLAVMLSFLYVFKTQTAYQKYWAATQEVDGLMQTSRFIARATCTMIDWAKDPSVNQRAIRIIRLLALHFFVIVEYCQRTCANPETDSLVVDKLRENIRRITGEREFAMLYPDESYDLRGSLSKHAAANPTVVSYWIQLQLGF